MDVFLLRHGQSEYNIGLTDHLDSPLTDWGQRQAARAAERLAGEGLSHIYVSPLRRTLQTVAPLCRMTGLPAEATPDACEYFSSRSYLQFPGMTREETEREFPFVQWSDEFPCEPQWWPQQTETDAHIYARAVRVRDRLLEHFAGTDKHVLIVSHADTVGRLTEAFLRVPPRPNDPPWSDNCAVTRLLCPADPARPATLLYANDAAYLGDLRS